MLALDQLPKFRQEFSEKELFFSFNGPMSNEFVVQIGKALKQKMQLNDVSKGTVLRVFAMVIEQTQNIINYSSEKHYPVDPSGENVRSGILCVGFDGNSYHIFCGNQITKEKVPPLRQRLELISSMNRDELKSHYKEVLHSTPEADSKGAGLGLIEMARKSSDSFEFNFSEVDAEHSFFSLKTVVCA
ncbi:MAG: hypothetical protein A2508_03110 [Candidatus Lambdaproteobacteria bacterium RIFOXYD12_FULL_49_8]|uniref:Histidine kinase/HSP90-like ATPase domain-containing protein n=1 Tax=Candidatus Lambdaproteobacteria bacterium RIFOXYD2_FULL_50_16 TaxID=1817772 RepID=A0A1F6GA87_9PROT|nr:MAG: hypothetical protein A2527_12685 [Candidatus Lambdaproteobacteria bacterium RIFOXYD2_FULL_50_16]OGG98288.1 MAG: hypothetical protein A2508_03110 [Candidatus Lambdaproteobacteria bacterium RIFOXYD12_FULL_49_8]